MKIVAAAALLLSTPAFAEPTIELVPTCVAIDTAHDELLEEARPHARLLLVRALERLDQLIVETGCSETIELVHQRDGSLVHVELRSSTARRTHTAGVRDDMLEVYGAMAKSLLEPPPPPAPVDIDAEEPAVAPRQTLAEPFDVDAGEATPAQPRPASFYVMLGVAIHARMTGKSVAVGYRYGRARWKVDAGFGVVSADDGDDTSSSMAMRVQALNVARPSAYSTTYWGAGLALAGSEISTMTNHSEGSGLRVEATIGLELKRTSTSRFYLEGNLSLPMYTAGDRYPAAFVASMGAGL